MALIVCPLCVREDDVILLRTLPDGRKEAECTDCKFTFTYGSPTPEPAPARKTSAPRKGAPRSVPARPIAHVIQQFPKAADIDAERLERAEALKTQFLETVTPMADPNVERHWAKFRWVFSADGLDKAVIFDLKLFASDPTGASVGSTAELDKAWTLLGEFEGARRVRATTEHLLRGPGELEDRLTQLITGQFSMAMPHWDEALLVKTLAVVDPLRFLTVLTYEEKRAIVNDVYGLELPRVDETSWTIGRLAVWSNDLLVDLIGEGFADQQHSAQFLRWIRTQ